jgi:hypothetical protein
MMGVLEVGVDVVEEVHVVDEGAVVVAVGVGPLVVVQGVGEESVSYLEWAVIGQELGENVEELVLDAGAQRLFAGLVGCFLGCFGEGHGRKGVRQRF